MVVVISSVKLVDESSVNVKNTGLKLEELDEKAVVCIPKCVFPFLLADSVHAKI